jgi:hypothetical protein
VSANADVEIEIGRSLLTGG